mgnify:FL=1
MSAIAEKYGIDLTKEHKTGCPRCIRNGRDNSHNNLHVYAATKSAHCWSCGWTIASKEHREDMGWDDEEDYYEEDEVSTKELLTQEQADKIKEQTGTLGKGSRGISDESYKAYAVRFKYDESTGDVTETFYPYTEGYSPAGYKVRMIPKDFRSVGRIGKDSDLFGMWKWKNGGSKYILLTAGEVDCISAFNILEDYRKSRNSDFDAIPCVSSGIGEAGSYKQVQKHYEWLNTFERIVVCYDNDEAGQKALKKLSEVLPKGKMFVVNLPLKDINEMLEKGKEKQFIRCFYDAKPYSPDGILPSNGLTDKIIEGALTPKIPLPPFMHKLEKMMAGGIPLKTLNSLSSASGTGKSSIIEAMMTFWLFNSPYKVGIVSLESDASQFATKLLSSHVGRKIDLIESVDEKVEYLNSEYVQQKSKELWENEKGEARFYLIEDRDGGLESMKEKIMQLIVSCDVQLLIIDPYSDLIDSLSNEEQAAMMKWMKGMVKSHPVTFLLINHVRKSSGNQKANSTGAELHEEDIFGSSTVMKSCACNLLFMRNKEAEEDIERNTIKMKASKLRWTGITGLAGEYYYDNKTSKLYDKDEWLQSNPAAF